MGHMAKTIFVIFMFVLLWLRHLQHKMLTAEMWQN